MAWRAFSISGIDYTYTPVDTNIYTQIVNVPSDNYNNIGQIITDITWVEKTSLHDVTLVSKDGYTITCNSLDSGRELSIRFTKPNEEYASVGGGRYLSGTTYVTFGFFIDDENEVATFAPYATNYNNATRWQSGTNMGLLTNSNWLYTFLKEIEPEPSTWEIVKELMVDGIKYTWDFPTELENAILTTIENNGNPYVSTEITSLVPNHSMHDFNIVDYPFTLHKGSDGSWQGGTSYTIGLGTYSIPTQDTNGIKYTLSDTTSIGASYISNTNGTLVVFFVKNETTHQAAIMNVMSAWYLSGDMNRISLSGYGTPQAKYEQVYNDLIGAIPVPSSATEAGAGSGYIGNSLLSNKKMVGYNVPTSSDAGTETESTNEYHSEGVTGKAKVGNGKVKITFLG